MSSLPRLTVDHEADTAYLRVRDGRTARTYTHDIGMVAIDFDADEGILGYHLLTLNPTPPVVEAAKEASMNKLAQAMARNMQALMRELRRDEGEGDR